MPTNFDCRMYLVQLKGVNACISLILESVPIFSEAKGLITLLYSCKFSVLAWKRQLACCNVKPPTLTELYV